MYKGSINDVHKKKNKTWMFLIITYKKDAAKYDRMPQKSFSKLIRIKICLHITDCHTVIWWKLGKKGVVEAYDSMSFVFLFYFILF